MAIDWKPLLEIINANQRFVLSSHVRPDADAVGSELGLAALLEQRGKSVEIVNPSAIPPNLEFLDPAGRVKKLGEGITADAVADTDVHIIVDTSAWAQLLGLGHVFRRTKAVKVVIDHHASADDLGAIEFKDTTAEATGGLVFRMAEALQLTLPPESILPLFCAIATDTGWFRFPSTSGETLRTAGRLIDLGAEPHAIYEQLYEQYSSARLKLAGCVLSRVTLDCDDRLAYTWVEQADFAKTGAKPVDTEDLVNECLKVSGTRCAFIAIEQLNASVKVSFRSRSGWDVAQVAERFGGGGHMLAAGAVIRGTLDEVKQQVIAAMKTVMDSSGDEN